MLQKKYPFELPPLPYPHEALEPYIDTETMHYHHDKHFKTYVDNLNAALAPYPELHKLTLEQILMNPHELPPDAATPILRNAGGVYNHDLYFKKLAPGREKSFQNVFPHNMKNIPTGQLAKDIDDTFGSFKSFKIIFSANAKNVFGSGWTYLVRKNDGTLEIVSTQNQDTPLMMGCTPIIIFDVWEHAYYLKYRNERANYIENLWNIVVFDDV